MGLRFIDLFAGLGGFHYALRALGHECVFASEIDPELIELYKTNFPEARRAVFGDIRKHFADVPDHDILCAGFPCQPFSKSGSQRGLRDRTRGTLFHEIIRILERHRPKYVILENVGNFERRVGGRTWRIVHDSLTNLGYDVCGTTHVASGGHGLISPHHLGYPQSRERFYIVASISPLPRDPFPKADRTRTTTLRDIVQSRAELKPIDIEETGLSDQQVECIDHWNTFIRSIPEHIEIPSFPLWGDEFGARYPYRDRTPHSSPLHVLARATRYSSNGGRPRREELLARLPAYARREEEEFPDWKIDFITQNRAYYRRVSALLPAGWRRALRAFPPSLRKLEWNCNGEDRDLWQCVLQFRPSGLRAKRFSSAPALVAMTVTQIPILGPKRRFITRGEGLRLQGFPSKHKLPKARAAAFAALGNAVHTGVVCAIAHRLLKGVAHESEWDAPSWMRRMETARGHGR